MKRYIKCGYSLTVGSPDLVDVELVKTWQGYEIQGTDVNGKHWYVSKVRKDGTYEWVSDFLYARHFKSESIAQKHLDNIFF